MPDLHKPQAMTTLHNTKSFVDVFAVYLGFFVHEILTRIAKSALRVKQNFGANHL